MPTASKASRTVPLRTYTKAIQLKPDYAAEVYNNRGNAYGKKGDYDRAIADFQRKQYNSNPIMPKPIIVAGLLTTIKVILTGLLQTSTKQYNSKPDYADPYSNRISAYGTKKAIMDHSH